MNLCKVKSLTIGSGLPKICVPIVAQDKESLFSQLDSFSMKEIDFIEWRVDFMNDLFNTSEIITIAQKIQTVLPDKPLLFTFRSQKEGGEQELALEDYFSLNLALAKSGVIDLVDLELFCTEDTKLLSSVINELQSYNTKVILSNHDFKQTPDEETILSRLRLMQDLGADIAKIAVMPNKPKDVLTLLSATECMHKNYAKIPIITMSMGQLGSISRISGECFGSSVTFGALKKASAPGQIPVTQLHEILNTISQ